MDPHLFSVDRLRELSGGSTFAVVVGSIIIAATASVAYYQSLSRRTVLWKKQPFCERLHIAQGSDLTSSERKYETIRFNQNELGALFMVPSVSSITFYAGKPPIALLQQRIKQIINANPWLASRLVTVPGVGAVALYPRGLHLSPSDGAFEYFNTTSDCSLHSSLPYTVISRKAIVHVIRTGNDCLDHDETLFKVTLVHTSLPDADYCTYALIVSLSHILGDGHTFYKVNKAFI